MFSFSLPTKFGRKFHFKEYKHTQKKQQKIWNCKQHSPSSDSTELTLKQISKARIRTPNRNAIAATAELSTSHQPNHETTQQPPSSSSFQKLLFKAQETTEQEPKKGVMLSDTAPLDSTMAWD